MNVGDLEAIDVHTHAEVSASGHPSLPEHLMAGSARYFRMTGCVTMRMNSCAFKGIRLCPASLE